MTKQYFEYVSQCIRDDVHRFYIWRRWIRARKAVLKLDKGECQKCKAKGRYRRATMVHHVNHLRQHPELALDIWYIDDEGKQKRQLISLCDECHDEEHPERLKQNKPRHPVTEERWE